MIKLATLAGVAAIFAMTAAAAAQTTAGSSAAPSDEATQPLGSTTPSGRPYSDSGSGLPRDLSEAPPMNAPSNAAQHGADSAAQTHDESDAAKIDRCKAMPGEAMTKDAACKAMMKKHPTMMNGGDSAPQ
jgi:hypothetical protein